ncbi:MAG TPA: CsiV family protein [Cellvibrio sp.]|jgi:hypothetical protein|nr:CsiV family protein [Cellvibrio sp.]
MINENTNNRFFIAFKTLRQFALFGVAIMAGLSPWSQAQANNQRWYQVEMVVFARQNPDSQEYWPTNIKLGYPLNWVELKNPDSASQTNTTTTDAPAVAQPSVDLLRDPFYLLPDSDKKLRNHAAALQRDPRYRILAHHAWRQFIGDQKRAPAILIKGGNAFGNHRELEGSITLSVAQYLQLRTNLWFSEFEINYGQAPGEWPQLPQSPNQLRAEILAADRAEPASEMSDFDQWSSLNTMTTEATLSNLSEPYLTKRIVLMEQERRMRSSEMHYLDHPLFGLIIQITPYSPPPASAGLTTP